MEVIENDNCIYVDCDDTLVMWDNVYKKEDKSNCIYINDPYFSPSMYGNIKDKIELVPNNETIEYIKNHVKFQKGTVIVWSAGGWQWAEAVVKALELEEFVTAVQSKSVKYLDDLPSEKFMGEWINMETKFKKDL